MTYIYTQPNLTSGIDDALVDIATAVPAFSIGTLFFVYFTILLGGIFSQDKRQGYADVAMWNLLASVSTFLVSLLMTIKEGIIAGWVLGVVVAITILSGFWYFMGSGRNEA
jgi:hypothetical protein